MVVDGGGATAAAAAAAVVVVVVLKKWELVSVQAFTTISPKWSQDNHLPGRPLEAVEWREPHEIGAQRQRGVGVPKDAPQDDEGEEPAGSSREAKALAHRSSLGGGASDGSGGGAAGGAEVVQREELQVVIHRCCIGEGLCEQLRI